ncbi:hypothetical protein H8F21_15020 [Pseudomonas sp. P66]|uniref:DUF1534 domain-containing protein n=1 Tax=Pseudomonas arcuscaelestis TaxID=2710591 RepID=A0ABS2BZ31_9PSED|nr:hypothetical protein [Pseudomonas arcuscaelestis]MBM5458876.1 hypothetical protein [Pseudomonas arcuscaelestis]
MTIALPFLEGASPDGRDHTLSFRLGVFISTRFERHAWSFALALLLGKSSVTRNSLRRTQLSGCADHFGLPFRSSLTRRNDRSVRYPPAAPSAFGNGDSVQPSALAVPSGQA